MKPKTSHKRFREPVVDAVVGDRLIDVKHGEGAIRDLRSSLLEISYQLAARGADFRAYLVLDHPSITPERLQGEWDLAQGVLRPEILDHLTLCVTDSGRFVSYPRETDTETQAAIAQVVSTATRRQSSHHDRGSSWFVVTKVLISSWLRADGPITTDQLMRSTGYSYPTVAAVLRDLQPYFARTTARRVELRDLPRDLVERLLRESERARRTMRFADRARKIRPPSALVTRLAQIAPSGLALGGVLGAYRYCPDLDITGAPVIDVTQRADAADGLDFVRRLDPDLRPTTDPHEPAVFFVHTATEADPMFEPGDGPLSWASPLECLLDLHEARLPLLALQLYETLKFQRHARP